MSMVFIMLGLGISLSRGAQKSTFKRGSEVNFQEGLRSQLKHHLLACQHIITPGEWQLHRDCHISTQLKTGRTFTLTYSLTRRLSFVL